MSDHIAIRGLVVETRIGVTDKERSRPQDVRVDVEIDLDLSRPARSDDLNETVDYDSLVTAIATLVRGQECSLLEHLAGQICDLVAAKDGVDGVTVEIAKTEAPVSEEVSAISVRMARPGRGSN